MLTDEVKKAIEKSVLCWLATQSEDGYPTFSPNEAFLHDEADGIPVASIASPQGSGS
jgi:predicted pyridoxine 5'-phosphate oxidase superfamily flavin-nucleotide-binding protein